MDDPNGEDGMKKVPCEDVACNHCFQVETMMAMVVELLALEICSSEIDGDENLLVKGNGWSKID